MREVCNSHAKAPRKVQNPESSNGSRATHHRAIYRLVKSGNSWKCQTPGTKDTEGVVVVVVVGSGWWVVGGAAAGVATAGTVSPNESLAQKTCGHAHRTAPRLVSSPGRPARRTHTHLMCTSLSACVRAAARRDIRKEADRPPDL